MTQQRKVFLFSVCQLGEKRPHLRGSSGFSHKLGEKRLHLRGSSGFSHKPAPQHDLKQLMRQSMLSPMPRRQSQPTRTRSLTPCFPTKRRPAPRKRPRRTRGSGTSRPPPTVQPAALPHPATRSPGVRITQCSGSV